MAARGPVLSGSSGVGPKREAPPPWPVRGRWWNGGNQPRRAASRRNFSLAPASWKPGPSATRSASPCVGMWGTWCGAWGVRMSPVSAGTAD